MGGGTYADTGFRDVSVQPAGSGLDKRQVAVQIALFADGVPRIKPFVIFRGQGLRIQPAERNKYDSRVYVTFQSDAWVNEEMLIFLLGIPIRNTLEYL